MTNSLSDLNELNRSIYDNIISSIKTNVDLAKQYSNRRCNQCTGKGYFDRDRILPGKQQIVVDNKPSRVTEKERKICFCVTPRIIKEILEIEVKDAQEVG